MPGNATATSKSRTVEDNSRKAEQSSFVMVAFSGQRLPKSSSAEEPAEALLDGIGARAWYSFRFHRGGHRSHDFPLTGASRLTSPPTV
ncbi:MAG: hypothetical protein HYZ17_07590 [Betaproteobacteria bacterium]|jgi:hypothetical protein|nr:hypothetical protein [Betaproteobacteria bacterium]